MDDSNISALLEQYCASFRPGNADAIARYYHYPATIFSGGIVIPLSSHAEVNDMLSGILSELAKRDFSHSIITKLHIHRFSDDVALVSASFSRLNTKGDVLEDLAATYTLHKSLATDWKIAVLITHEIDRLIS